MELVSPGSAKYPAKRCDDVRAAGAGALVEDPKSSLRAGLFGPDSRSWKCMGANLPLPESEKGLLTDFSGEKIPSWLRILRLAGLKRLGAPGDKGRLFVLEGIDSWENCSRDSSRRGPGRFVDVAIVVLIE